MFTKKGLINNNQSSLYKNGFIQIPALVIFAISILFTSVGTGLILHKKDKSSYISGKEMIIEPTPTLIPTPVPSPSLEIFEENKPEKILTTTQQSNEIVENEIEQPSPSPIPSFEYNNQPQTYSIVSFPVDTSSYSEGERAVWVNAYNEFLQTPNLEYMNHNQQDQLLTQIVQKYYDEYKHKLEQEILLHQDYVNELQDLNNNQSTQSNSDIESKLSELSQTLKNIQNQPVAMNVIVGKQQRAYQDWTGDNQEIYSQILSSSVYFNQLTAILATYGL